MPVIKSAIKKLRKDRSREKRNDLFRKNLEQAIRAAKKQKTDKAVSSAVSLVDRAVKKNIIHKNKGARIKSSFSKLSKEGTKPSVSSQVKVKAKKSSKVKKTKAKKSTK